MSWIKFWNRKSKKDSKTRSDLARSDSFKEETNWQTESEKDKNAKLRHTMSISRSGRFKQRQKQRAGILDKPELYDGTAESDRQKENVPANNVPQSRHMPINYTNDIHANRSPPGTCRDVSGQTNMAPRRYEGQATVL